MPDGTDSTDLSWVALGCRVSPTPEDEFLIDGSWPPPPPPRSSSPARPRGDAGPFPPIPGVTARASWTDMHRSGSLRRAVQRTKETTGEGTHLPRAEQQELGRSPSPKAHR